MSETIRVKVGDTFDINLEGHPTAGFIWQPIVPHNYLEHLDTHFEAKSSMVGGAARQHFLFRALAPGNIALVFRYGRPWERDKVSDERIFSIRIDPAH
jgi:predicted secreted protein